MKNRRGHLPPRTTGPVGAPPPAMPADALIPRPTAVDPGDRVAQVLREGFAKVADSLDNALATVAQTNRVTREVGNQERRWGLQSWPDGTGPETRPIEALGGWYAAPATEVSEAAKRECDNKEVNGLVTWFDILIEEVLEVAAEDPSLDNEKLDTELTQAAAVIVSWLKDRAARRVRRDNLATKGYDPAHGPAPASQPETGNRAEGLGQWHE